MNKVLAMLCTLVLLSGCERANDLQLNADRISSIDVTAFGPGNQTQLRQITNRQTISQLVNCLNQASKELNKFYPSYKLVFRTPTKADSAIIRGSSFKMADGRRYVADCDIEQLLR